MLVKVSVCHIVQTTACATHENGAEGEHGQQMPARETVCRNPQRRQGGPQQQQPTCGTIPPNQIQIQAYFFKHVGWSF
jgi:hypothetical protein